MNSYMTNIITKRMTFLLKNSVLEYLDTFETREKFTAENGFLAMTNHYKEIHMADFYSTYFPKEDFYLITDQLSLNIHSAVGYPVAHNTNPELVMNYTKFSLSRRFTFEDLLDETIEINLHLYFGNTESKEKANATLKKDDLVLNGYADEEPLNQIIENEWYQKHKNSIPFLTDLYINYNL